jgi:hypothetical protein
VVSSLFFCIHHVAREGDAKQSFLFLRNELPVRLASMMKEMGHLPPRLLEVPSVRTVNGWYGSSLHDLHTFKDSPPSNDVVKKYGKVRKEYLAVTFLSLDLQKSYKTFVRDIQLWWKH